MIGSPPMHQDAPAAGRGNAGFPVDPDFPQLEIASDPARMLEVFRAHLKPVAGKAYDIDACVPVRFRCRQSTSRCVLQYSLRVIDRATGAAFDRWVTGTLYARPGDAERLWRGPAGAGPPRTAPAPRRAPPPPPPHPPPPHLAGDSSLVPPPPPPGAAP